MSEQTRTQKLMARAEEFLMPNYGVRDTALVRGSGVRAWDAEGNEYLDFLAGIGVNSLGHCYPPIVEAIQKQAATLMHTSNGVLIGPQVDLGEKICRELFMDKALFVNSGAEATEAAMKLVRYWGKQQGGESRYKIMVFKGSFHGRTMGAISATWSPKCRDGFEPFLPGYVFAEYNNLEDVDAKWDDDVCAVMLETVQGEGGLRPATKEFLQGLRKRCDQRNAALICDEIQCGMGRTGKRMAYMYAGIQPDLLALAKGLGGGFPIGCLVARGKFADVFTPGKHGTTFGGNPLACAAALAACNTIFDDEFLAEVADKACFLWGGLDKIVAALPNLCEEVRGLGLMQGIALKASALPIPKLARQYGLIVNATAGTVVRALPPLIITKEEISEGLEKLLATLQAYEKSL